MAKEKSYQQLRGELDEVVASFQSGELDIEAATKQYERGTQVVKELQEYLKTAEIKIEKIKAKFKG